jgi:hypothetical protein
MCKLIHGSNRNLGMPASYGHTGSLNLSGMDQVSPLAQRIV